MGDTKILTVTGAGGGVVLAAARGGGGGGGSRLVCRHPGRSERDGNNRRAKQNNKTQRLSTTQAANLAQSCPNLPLVRRRRRRRSSSTSATRSQREPAPRTKLHTHQRTTVWHSDRPPPAYLGRTEPAGAS
jgi:hypothetical protein